MADEGDEERRCQHIPDKSETLDSSASNDSLDLMIGAERIATFMFSDPEETRQVYHIWKSHGLPAFKVGNALWARKKSIMKWIKAREAEQEEMRNFLAP
jgi:hypothetical protein